MALESAVLDESTEDAVAGCGEPSCGAGQICSTDVYCEHDRFLPTVRWTTAGRITFALTWRVAVCAAFLASAQLRASLPVYIAVVALGAAMLGLPLRRFPVAGPAAVIAWMALCIIVPVSLNSSDADNDTVITVAAIATLTVWLVSFVRFAFLDSNHDTQDDLVAEASFISALALAGVCAAVSAVADLPYARDVLVIPEAAKEPLPVIALIGVAGAGLAALLGGLLRAADSDAPGQPPGLASPGRPRPMTRPARPRRPARSTSSLDLGALVLRMMARFVDEVGYAARVLGRSIVQALRWFLYGLVVALVSIINAIWRWFVQTLRVIWGALRLLPGALRRSIRVVAIPFGALTAGAWLAYLFAEVDLIYLTTGSISSLLRLLACGAGVTLALTVAWIALSDQAILVTIRSAAVTLSTFAAAALVLAAVGGWIVGLFGTFGYGPIRVGWVTLGATAILVVSAAWSALRNRRSDRSDDPPATTEEPAPVAAAV
jgi:hypothetical protein